MADDNEEKPDTAKAAPKKDDKKTAEQLATERLKRNGYSDEQIDEALETYGAASILARKHRLECGDVGDLGKHGDLGADALKP